MDVVTLDNVPNLLRLNRPCNLGNVVVVLLRPMLELSLLVFSPGGMSKRREGDFAKSGNGRSDVAVVDADELEGFVEDVDAGGAVHLHALDLLEEGVD